MQRSLLKWWLSFFWVTRIGGSQKIWEPDDSLVNQRIMKSILESCYESESLANPIVIIGDFSEFIDKSSVIKFNELYKFDEEAQSSTLGKVSYVAGKIILIEDSPKKLESDLRLLQATRWWDHMALFFIIEKNTKTCENFKDMLLTTWKMDILNSIYICTESNNEAALYTFNPIANYAPSPWKRREVRPEHLAMFRQIFDSHIACENLHYDKTKILDGYEITVVVDDNDFIPEMSRIYFEEFNEHLRFHGNYLLIWSLFASWDVTARIERVESLIDMMNGFEERTADMSFKLFASGLNAKRVIPTYFWFDIIALGKFQREESTLTEICQLWSSSVSIAAGITLGILLIILTIQNHNFVTAVLDLIRLLTYTSISADNRSHKFRIYFTTMLIFIVIINGVFQGFIVTFLIKPERVNPPPTFDEIGELGYKIYTHPFNLYLLREAYPKYDIEGITLTNCIMAAQNKPHHACVLHPFAYGSESHVDNFDAVNEPVFSEYNFFANRENWPLQNSVIKRFSRLSESGLLDHWMTAQTEVARLAFLAREAQQSSLQYKPLKFNDLTFAFQLLALGLVISTIVFFIELIVGKWREC